MSNATPSRLQQAVLEVLCQAFENGVTATDDDGNVVTLTPSAQYINAATSFLKTFPPQNDPAEEAEKSAYLREMESKMKFAKRQ